MNTEFFKNASIILIRKVAEVSIKFLKLINSWTIETSMINYKYLPFSISAFLIILFLLLFKDFVIQALFTTWFITQHVAPEDIYYKPSFLAARPAGRPAIAKLPSSTAYHPKTTATFPPKTDKLYDRSDTYATTGVKPYKRSLTNYKYGTGMYINL